MMFGLFRRKTAFKALINGVEPGLTVAPGQRLLDAALTAGLPWRHKCNVGSCGACRCRLESGRIKALTDFSYVLTPEQLARNMILACQTELRSDVVLTVSLGQGTSASPSRTSEIVPP
jgi:toluene methyl-monooxygenase electron transfer component